MNDFSIQKLTKTKTKTVKNKPTTIVEVETVVVPITDAPTTTPTNNNLDAVKVLETVNNLPTNAKIVVSSGIGLVLICLFCACCRLLFFRKKRRPSLSNKAREELGYPLTPPVPQTPRTILRQRMRQDYQNYRQEQEN